MPRQECRAAVGLAMRHRVTAGTVTAVGFHEIDIVVVGEIQFLQGFQISVPFRGREVVGILADSYHDALSRQQGIGGAIDDFHHRILIVQAGVVVISRDVESYPGAVAVERQRQDRVGGRCASTQAAIGEPQPVGA